MDTPGLADIGGQANAAEQIEDGLKQSGKVYKINFVMKLNGGRIETEDIRTIDTVMTALSRHGNDCAES